MPIGPRSVTAGIQFWYEAGSLGASNPGTGGTGGQNLSDGASIVTGSGAGAGWSDSSGSGILTPLFVDTGTAPVYRATGAPGSNPAVEFSGSAGMTRGAAAPTFSAATLFAVVDCTSITVLSAIVAVGGAPEFRINTSGYLVWQAQGVGQIGIYSADVSNAWHVLSADYVNTAGGAWNIYVDGTNVANGVSIDNVYSTPAGVHVGEEDTSTQAFTGYIAEVVGYDGVLSASDRAKVHSYFQDLYGITVSDYVSSTASITTGEIEYHYGGGGTATSVLGGAISSAQITSGAANNVWDDITSGEAASGETTYACIYVKNNTAGGRTWTSPMVWVDVTPGTGESVSVNTQATLVAKNTSAGTIANETTAPSSIGFTAANAPATKAAGVQLPDLAPGDYQAIWLQRVVGTGTTGHDPDAISIRTEGDTL